MQTICMTKDRGTAAAVTVASLGTRAGFFLLCSPYLFTVLATPSSQEIPPSVLFENAPLAEG